MRRPRISSAGRESSAPSTGHDATAGRALDSRIDGIGLL
jgi:hypothetical protein